MYRHTESRGCRMRDAVEGDQAAPQPERWPRGMRLTMLSISERGYARPELLAQADWLAERLADPRVRVIDARSAEQYAAGHIAGALHMDGFGSGIPRAENGDMAPPEEFARIVGALGIGNDTTV